MSMAITIVELPNGRVGFQVDGGRIYAALAAAERFAAALGARVARYAARKAEAVRAVVAGHRASKGTVAGRVRRLVEKAARLAEKAHRRASEARSHRRATDLRGQSTVAERSRAGARYLGLSELARLARVRVGRLEAARRALVRNLV